MVDNTRDSKSLLPGLTFVSQLSPEETGSVGIDRQIERLEIRRSLRLQRSAGNLIDSVFVALPAFDQEPCLA